MADLFKGVELHKKDGSKTKGDEALKGKIVALYFSAHWCPPCRQFTPVLKDFYGELVDESDKEFEIVFVSFDRSADDLKSYMAEDHGDWYFLPFGSEKIQELSTQFSVSGIPAMIVLKPNGDVITKNGRADVQGGKAPVQAFDQWAKA
uniref:Thioredoxin domain-containing protein n=1 Tax=Plectus sambesii TaxID=2011161 RepID=A0A914VZ26_9BILA